jgi:hypothetical protein
MITIQVYDYSKSGWNEGPHVTIFNENQLEEVSKATGQAIADIKAHIAKAYSNGGKHVAYLTPTSWASLLAEKKEKNG